jgi:hypoxanthine-guanine phosphoribosyltransferase
MAAIMMYGPGRSQSVSPAEREKSVKASLTAICAPIKRSSAKTAQMIAILSQNGAVSFAAGFARALEAQIAISAQAA